MFFWFHSFQSSVEPSSIKTLSSLVCKTRPFCCPFFTHTEYIRVSQDGGEKKVLPWLYSSWGLPPFISLTAILLEYSLCIMFFLSHLLLIPQPFINWQRKTVSSSLSDLLAFFSFFFLCQIWHCNHLVLHKIFSSLVFMMKTSSASLTSLLSLLMTFLYLPFRHEFSDYPFFSKLFAPCTLQIWKLSVSLVSELFQVIVLRKFLPSRIISVDLQNQIGAFWASSPDNSSKSILGWVP